MPGPQPWAEESWRTQSPAVGLDVAAVVALAMDGAAPYGLLLSLLTTAY